MQPKADMVPKDSTNQKQFAAYVRIAWRFACSPAMARDGELIQMQYFFHHRDTICHPNSSYVTTKINDMKCRHVDVTIIRSFRKELFSRFLPSTYDGHVSLAAHSLGYAAKVAIWRHWWIHHFTYTFKIPCQIFWLYCKVVLWYTIGCD